jgi:hypothetical protein
MRTWAVAFSLRIFLTLPLPQCKCYQMVWEESRQDMKM